MMFVDGENVTMEGQKLLSAKSITPVPSRAFCQDTFLWSPHPNIVPNILRAEWNKKPHALLDRAERCFYYTYVQGNSDIVPTVQAELRHLNFTPRVFKKGKGYRAKGVDIALTKDLLAMPSWTTTTWHFS